jgi:uncharacterized iron-regulated membrane protein
MTAKELIGLLHLWLGLASGLVVFILGLTGCIYAFEDEIRELVYHERLYITPEHKARLPVSTLLGRAQKQLGNHYQLNMFEVTNAPDRTYRFMAFKINDQKISYFGQREYSYNVYVNPYNGQVVKVENNKYEFFTLVLYLHYDLFLAKIGKQIVGWSTIVFIVLLISGVVLWWPKNKSAVRQRVWFQWKDTTKWKRKNYDLHNILGFYFMSLCLIISLTGLVWAFTWFSESVQYMANGGVATPKPKIIFSDTASVKKDPPLDAVLRDLQKRIPQAASYSFFLPRKESDVLNATALFDGTERYKFVTNQYDQHTGRLLQNRRFDEKPRGEKLRNMNYDLHVGSILGFPGKVLAFFASLTATSLPITGIVIWWGRRKKEKSKTANDKQRSSKTSNSPARINPAFERKRKAPIPEDKT